MLKLLSLPACPIRQFMSLIGYWKKGDPSPKTGPCTPPAFTMVAEGRRCTYRPTIIPNKACSAIIYRRINRRVGRSLKRAHCRRNRVPPGKQAAHNYLELKAGFLALKEFQELCSNKIVLVATDNTTVVSYIDKEGCSGNLDLVYQHALVLGQAI